MRIHSSAFIHSKAEVDLSVVIGARTRVWQFASVIRGTVLGEDCNVASGALLDGPRFGDRCVICQNVAMGPGFVFGDDCLIGPNVTVCNDMWPEAIKEGFDYEALRSGTLVTVRAGNRVSIGANAVILPGVNLGDGCFVAAGAVVERDVPPTSVIDREGRIRPLPSRRRRMKEAKCSQSRLYFGTQTEAS